MTMNVDTQSKRKGGENAGSAGGGKEGKKGRKDKEPENTEEGYKMLVALLARLGLSSAGQCRLVKSIAITTMAMERSLKNKQEDALLSITKATTKKFFEDTKDIPPDKRAAAGPVHATVYRRTQQWIIKHITEMEDVPDCPQVVKAFKIVNEYEKELQKVTAAEAVCDVARRIRYCRLQTCFKRSKMKLELAAGGASAEGQKLHDALCLLMRTQAGAEEKLGIAPPNGLERKVKQQMMLLGIQLHEKLEDSEDKNESASSTAKG
eukprot:TRINITY_DN110989_c0_g1_i1.p2 TRINITY_DN110989_c0_g1~~TRINITY_DN110989_c0_g1_i1.p2  ORF type:complete len:264 (-),score=89.45 TRINITY_DN110989_c0_g1_i1:204-995(-)